MEEDNWTCIDTTISASDRSFTCSTTPEIQHCLEARCGVAGDTTGHGLTQHTKNYPAVATVDRWSGVQPPSGRWSMQIPQVNLFVRISAIVNNAKLSNNCHWMSALHSSEGFAPKSEDICKHSAALALQRMVNVYSTQPR